MHVIVTGGAGFIGSHIVEFHLQKGDTVHAIDNLVTGNKGNLQPFLHDPNFTFDEADILTWPDLKKALENADRIYHMAAVVGVLYVLQEPLNVLVNNINGTERLLKTLYELQSKARIFIASTSSVYGHIQKSLLCESDDLNIHSISHPLCGYAISKISSEVMSMTYHRLYNMPITVLRLFNTVGPRQTGCYGMVVPRFIEEAIANEPIIVYGDGLQTRSFCDVRDTLVALDLLANNPKSIGEIVNVGNDREISINNLAYLIKRTLHSNSEVLHISYEKAYGKKFEDIKKRKPDITKLKKLTGFKPKWTLENTIADLMKNMQDKEKVT
ncbi:MAG TPA: GDP-mannose 4,6-dehydratase [Gammaproteobacteria bacterium]|jgi:UDP-glucose 4-epimerase|nr:GDP-mannose 4,6-dehydratase [Gammaproteobacteria bacterium]